MFLIERYFVYRVSACREEIGVAGASTAQARTPRLGNNGKRKMGQEVTLLAASSYRYRNVRTPEGHSRSMSRVRGAD